ncbi:MAG: BON domain-containing protein [Chromatiaceae bacterium]|nr:BON domain-containing protein [Chromatiaceae bacterium]
MIIVTKVGLVTASLALVLIAVGCDKNDSAEQAGKKIDQAAARSGEAIEKAGDKASTKLDTAKEAIGDKAEAAGVYMSDAAITTQIKAGLLADSTLKSLQIHVTTTNGVVALSGVVDSQQSIDRSLEIARGIKGVASVENRLVVKPAQ